MFVIALLFCVVHTLHGVHTTNEQIAVCSGKKGTVGRWVTKERLKRLPSVSETKRSVVAANKEKVTNKRANTQS